MRKQRWSHKDAICDVDLLFCCLPKISSSSSTSPVHRLPPRFDLWREQMSRLELGIFVTVDGRMFVWSPAIPLQTRSVRYFSTPPLTTVWSNYPTLFNDFFEVYITKMVTLSPNVQSVLLISSTLWISITWPITLRSDWSIVSQLTNTVNMTSRSSSVNQ